MGTGLGLAIVDVIARAHGGRAGIADRRGGGADVWIALHPARTTSNSSRPRTPFPPLRSGVSSALHLAVLELRRDLGAGEANANACPKRGAAAAALVDEARRDRDRRADRGLHRACRGGQLRSSSKTAGRTAAATRRDDFAREVESHPAASFPAAADRRAGIVSSSESLAAATASGASPGTAGGRVRRLVTPTSSSFPALGTTAVVCVTNAAALADARVALERELSAIDRACSRFRPDSELVRLNAGAGAAVQVGEALFEAIAVALRVAAATHGLVDPTVGRSLRLAGYDRTFEQVRTGRREGPSFVAAPGWQTVEIDAGSRTVRLPPGGELDLGATAKALAADRSASAIARSTGCGSARVSRRRRCGVRRRSAVTAGRSGSPTTMQRRSTGLAPWSRSRRGDSRRPAPPFAGGAPAARSFTTSSTPAPAGRPRRRGERSPSPRRRASTPTPRAPRHSFSERMRPPGSPSAGCRHGSSPRPAPSTWVCDWPVESAA